MSSVWGTTPPEMTDGETTCVLEHAVVEPNFLKSAEIMHESVLTGHRSWSRNESYVEFSVMDYLCEYANPNTKALEILAFEDKDVTFTFATDGGMVQQMRVVDVNFFPLIKPNRDDVAVIHFMNIDYLQVSRRIRAIPGKEWIKNTPAGKILRTRGIII